MAIQVGSAYIPVKADMSSFGKEVDQGTKGALGSIKSFAKTAALTMGGAFAVTKGVDFLKGSIGAASDLNETVSKARTIFGPAADDLERWASGSAKAFGQSKQQALDAASTFGNLFVQLGISSEAASGMSTEMVELASDFASFHNADPTEVINAQTAAFRGEYDALQRFVPTINAAAVEQEALRATGKKATKELTLQEKAIAVQALMMKGAGDATGDFARTSDSLANKQRIASAQWADMTAKIGQGLLPIMTSLMGFVSSKLLPGFEKAGEVLGKAGKFVADNREYFIGFGAAILVSLVPALVTWATATWAVVAAKLALLAPFILTAAAVAAFVAGIIWAYQNVDIFRNAVDTVASFLRETVWPLIQAGARLFTDTLVPAIQRVIEFYWNFYSAVLETMGGIASWIGEKVADVIGFFTDLASKVSSIARSLWDPLASTFRGVLNTIIGAWNALDIAVGPYSIPDWVPLIGGNSFHIADMFPDIPYLGGGGSSPLESAHAGRGVRVMHSGGTVTPNGIVPLRSDEVLAKLQVGETVLPAGDGGRTTIIHVNNPVQETAADTVTRLRHAVTAL